VIRKMCTCMLINYCLIVWEEFSEANDSIYEKKYILRFALLKHVC